jgi:hypothetical protein
MRSLRPAKISLVERASLKYIAPDKTVRFGERNFNITASDKERYCREKYIPERVVNLR